MCSGGVVPGSRLGRNTVLTQFLAVFLSPSMHTVYCILTEGVYCTLTEVFLTLTEVFPYFFLSCKANSRVKLAKTGHGPHCSKLVVVCVVLCIVCV